MFPGKHCLDLLYNIGTLTQATARSSHQHISSELIEYCYGTLTDPVKIFLKNVRGAIVPDDDRAILGCACQAHDLATSAACEGKLRKVLEALEKAFFKDRNNLSDGLTYSLCILAFVSDIYAKILVWRTQESREGLDLGDPEARGTALEILFSLVKPSHRKEFLLRVQKAAEVEIDREISPAKLGVGTHQNNSFYCSIRMLFKLELSRENGSSMDMVRDSESRRGFHSKTVQGTTHPPKPRYQGQDLESNPTFTSRAESDHRAHWLLTPETWSFLDPQRLLDNVPAASSWRANSMQPPFDARLHEMGRRFMDLSEDNPEAAVQDDSIEISQQRTHREGSNINLLGQEQRDLSVSQNQQKAEMKWLAETDISAMNGAANHPYSPSRRPLKVMEHRDYTVGWICGLPMELAASGAMLDENHESLPQDSVDINNYRLGQIGGHNVVIACLPSIGTGIAIVKSRMLSTFPSIRLLLLVGVGGGAPSATNDIRLGDVVISKPDEKSMGMIHYHFSNPLEEGRFVRTASSNRPPDVLLNAINTLQANHLMEEPQLTKHLSVMLSKYPKMKQTSTYPGVQYDQLFHPSSVHRVGQITCAECNLNCVMPRPDRSDIIPRVHYGLIASVDQVIKDGDTRERLQQELGVLCFEMEAADLETDIPCLVIRGICDYADTHKNKRWQSYAAAVAAAYAKELLCIIPGNHVLRNQTIVEKRKEERECIHLACVR